jgi:hypothetical protein
MQLECIPPLEGRLPFLPGAAVPLGQPATTSAAQSRDAWCGPLSVIKPQIVAPGLGVIAERLGWTQLAKVLR